MVIRILGINGGMRADSVAGSALRLAMGGLGEEGAQGEVFEVGALPVMDGRPEEQYPATVAAWRAACEAADGFVVSVPPVLGGMPGGLKNAFDLLGEAQMGGKPFALIGVAVGDAEPGVTDAARTLRHLGGIAAVPDVVISRSRDHWGDSDRPSNMGVALAIGKVVEDLVAVAKLRAAGQLPKP